MSTEARTQDATQYRSSLCPPVLQDVPADSDVGQVLMDTCPGLFVEDKASGTIRTNSARGHELVLEKVRDELQAICLPDRKFPFERHGEGLCVRLVLTWGYGLKLTTCQCPVCSGM